MAKGKLRTCDSCEKEFVSADGLRVCGPCYRDKLEAQYREAAPTRTCTRCRQEKPHTAFATGRTECRSCGRDRQAAYRAKYRASNAPRKCARCQTIHPRTAFKSTSSYCTECTEAMRTERLANTKPKVCVGCGQLKEAEQFRAAWQRCRECRYVATAAKKVFSTPEELRKTYAAQKGLCKICGTAGALGALVADHSKQYKRFRGFLCQSCNLGIGLAYEKIETLSRMSRYVGDVDAT